jgi:hypothetical protein
MDHPLDLEWTVVDEMDGALAGMDSPVSRPPSPQPAGPVERPVLKLPHPRSPSEKARGPSTGSRDPASNIAPARAPAPDQSNAEAAAEDLYDGRKTTLTGALHKHRDFLAPSPYVGGAAFPATFAATLLLPLRDNGTAVQRLPLPSTPEF